jgi:hypothetical protein
MAHAESAGPVPMAEGVAEDLVSHTFHRLHQLGKAVLGVFDIASPYYDGFMDALTRQSKWAQRRQAGRIINESKTSKARDTDDGQEETI